MENQSDCKYCNGDEELIDTRTDYSRRGDFYPGVEAWIEENVLKIIAVGDTYEPSFTEVAAEIKYCPMCGRSLKDERSK